MADIPIEEIDAYLFAELSEERMREIDALSKLNPELKCKLAVIGTLLGVIPTYESLDIDVSSPQHDAIESHSSEGERVSPRSLLERVDDAMTRGDRAAIPDLFIEYYSDYQEAARKSLREMLPQAIGTEAFEQIMKQSFIQVWREIRNFRSGKASADAWILRLVYEQACNYLGEVAKSETLDEKQERLPRSLHESEEP